MIPFKARIVFRLYPRRHFQDSLILNLENEAFLQNLGFNIIKFFH